MTEQRSRENLLEKPFIQSRMDLMIQGKSPSLDRQHRKTSPCSPAGSGSLSPMTGQPHPVGYSPTQSGSQVGTPVSQVSSETISPIPSDLGFSPQSPKSPTFKVPGRSTSLSPQPLSLKLSGSSSSTSLNESAKPTLGKLSLGLNKPKPKSIFFSPSPQKKWSDPTNPVVAEEKSIQRAGSLRSLHETDGTEDFLQEIKEKMGKLSFSQKEVTKFKLQDLDNLGEIGRGITGRVFKMLHRPTGRVMAAKKMEWSGVRGEQKRVLMDLDVMTAQHCPYIVQYYGVIIEGQNVWLFMELMDTCIETLLKRSGPIPEPILGTILVSIIKALDYLKKEHKVIHRDVKPSNMLLGCDGQVKLCDFGISGHLVESKVFTRDAGVPAYMAPERITDGTAGYTVKADVWSLGISVVQMAEGKHPYPPAKVEFEVLANIVNSPPPLPRRGKYSEEFYSFMEACLTKDHRLRPEYHQLLAHPFIVKYATSPADVASWYCKTSLISNITNQTNLISFDP